MLIDVHTHPQLEGVTPLLEQPHGADLYRERASEAGVVRAGALVMAPRGDLAATRRANDAVLALARRDPFFFPVCSVHPKDGDEAFTELERVRGEGARWLKLHPNTQGFDVADPDVTALVGRAAALGMPVLFDAWSPWDPGQPGKFVQLALAVPEARLILAHAHGPNFAQLLVYEVLALYPFWQRRVWIDLSAAAPMFAGGPFAEQLVWVLRKVGVDRLLFGSDYPLFTPGESASAVRSLGFSEGEMAAIGHDNAAALLGDGAT